MATELTPANRSALRTALAEIDRALDESTPLGQAIQQRDAFARAWDDAVHEILKNLQEIRADNAAIRRRLDEAARHANEETAAILKAIETATELARSAAPAAPPAAPDPVTQSWLRRWFL